jgi:hypothetical protein
MAQVPWTPNAAKVLMSAAIPAPPPESEPAIVITTGVLNIEFFSVILFLISIFIFYGLLCWCI